jgi:hypothetical protein
MKDRMTAQEFVGNCITYGFEVELKYFERQTFDEFCIHIILGNYEYIIPTWDEYRLAELWFKDILRYYIY